MLRLATKMLGSIGVVSSGLPAVCFYPDLYLKYFKELWIFHSEKQYKNNVIKKELVFSFQILTIWILAKSL